MEDNLLLSFRHPLQLLPRRRWAAGEHFWGITKAIAAIQEVTGSLWSWQGFTASCGGVWFIIRYVLDDEWEGDAELSGPSALPVLMDSQRALCQQKLPATTIKKTIKKTKKIYFLRKAATEADSSGINLACNIAKCLWYVDGHHHMFEKQGCKIPDVFQAFTR